MSPLLRRLGLGRGDDGRGDYGLLRAQLQTSAAALEEIDRLGRLHTVAPELTEQLRTEYQDRIDQLRSEIRKLTTDQGRLRAQDIDQTRRYLLLVEKSHVANAYRQGLLSSSVHDQLLADIDARILELDSAPVASGQTKD